MRDFQVGEIVYAPYLPQRYGKIVDHELRGAQEHEYFLVRWKDGVEDWHWELHLKSLEQLVKDHRRKLATHERNVAKAQEL